MKKARDQRGFAVLEVLVLVGLLVVLGIVGYRAYEARQVNPSTLQNTKNKTKTEWMQYRSEKGVGFKYPRDWRLVSTSEDGVDNVVISGPNGFTVRYRYGITPAHGACPAIEKSTPLNVSGFEDAVAVSYSTPFKLEPTADDDYKAVVTGKVSEIHLSQTKGCQPNFAESDELINGYPKVHCLTAGYGATHSQLTAPNESCGFNGKLYSTFPRAEFYSKAEVKIAIKIFESVVYEKQ